MKKIENFTLAELTVTDTGLENTPSFEKTEKLLYLTIYILQLIRNKFGKIKITSAYRSYEVNKAVGGSETSQHTMGEAVDFIPLEAKLNDVYKWCNENINFGQLILEKNTWIHISLCRLKKPNDMALLFNGKNYQEYRGVLPNG